MRSIKRFAGLSALALLFVFALPAKARADLVGIRGGFYTKLSKPFLGGELILPLSWSVFLNPNVEYVFISHDTYLTLNADFHYDFHTHSRAYVWAGGGLAVIYEKPEGLSSTTDLGANFIFGIGAKGEVIPYVQAKLIAKKDTEFVVAFGLRF